MTDMAHKSPYRQAHPVEVYAPRYELALFPILILAVLLVLSLAGPA